MTSKVDLSKYFSFKRIIFPLILGLAIAAYFLSKDGFYQDELKEIDWGRHSLIWLIASITMMIIRDLGYILRLRILSSKELNWRQCFEIIVLWEFASAVSPGAIGGTAAAMVIMAQEKVKTGMTTAIVLTTSFLDELFYIIMVPIIFLLVGGDSLFPEFQNASFKLIINTTNLKVLFYGGYIFLFVWTVFLAFALFIKPQISRRIIVGVLSFRPLRKFRRKGAQLSHDLIASSVELKSKGMGFWYRAFGATFLSWTARFLMVNCLIMAFADVDDHMIIYGRQLIMWVILLIAITPGGAGVAEVLFPAFLGKFLPSAQIARMVAILWRLISYYPYIVIGGVVLPFWARRVQLYDRIRSRVNPASSGSKEDA
jgi:glycosyltransferase 2 family protein